MHKNVQGFAHKILPRAAKDQVMRHTAGGYNGLEMSLISGDEINAVSTFRYIRVQSCPFVMI